MMKSTSYEEERSFTTYSKYRSSNWNINDDAIFISCGLRHEEKICKISTALFVNKKWISSPSQLIKITSIYD